jgi:CRP-like cAMP-binding protein
LEPVILERGEFIFYTNETVKYVYFPTSGIISITSCSEEGRSIEIASVGKEGMAGIDVLLGVDKAANESMVQIAGAGYRVRTEIIRSLYEESPALQKLLRRYIHALLVLISQTAVCNRLHLLDQRLIRWLLLCRDRIESNHLPLTQEFLSTMLGTNRPSVTQSAIALQNSGHIEYKRGKVSILNAPALEELACECYHAVKDEYDSYQNNQT